MKTYWEDNLRTVYNKSCHDMSELYEIAMEYCELIIDRNKQGVLSQMEGK